MLAVSEDLDLDQGRMDGEDRRRSELGDTG